MKKISILMLFAGILLLATQTNADDFSYWQYNQLNRDIQQRNEDMMSRQRNMEYMNDSVRNYQEELQRRDLRDQQEDLDRMDRLRKFGF